MIEENVFKKTKIDFAKLESYGFSKINNVFVLERFFMGGAFKAIIKISPRSEIVGKVWDTECDEEYLLLHVESENTGFVLKVRNEYVRILQDIREYCCLNNYFIYPQANRLADKMLEIYGGKIDFPWEKYEGYGVFRNQKNNKWYALIININQMKLNKELPPKEIEVINVKLNTHNVEKLLMRKGFYPAYHMNKKNWVTIVLDETVDDGLLLELIGESHILSEK